jgi:hypothetical protein
MYSKMRTFGLDPMLHFQCNEHLYAFSPLPLTAYELIFLSIWIKQYCHKTKHQYKIETWTASDKIL